MRSRTCARRASALGTWSPSCDRGRVTPGTGDAPRDGVNQPGAVMESVHHANTEARLARGLGWFSLALGAAELAMPRQLARGLGVPAGAKTSAIMRVLGAREILSGL